MILSVMPETVVLPVSILNRLNGAVWRTGGSLGRLVARFVAYLTRSQRMATHVRRVGADYTEGGMG